MPMVEDTDDKALEPVIEHDKSATFIEIVKLGLKLFGFAIICSAISLFNVVVVFFPRTTWPYTIHAILLNVFATMFPLSFLISLYGSREVLRVKSLVAMNAIAFILSVTWSLLVRLIVDSNGTFIISATISLLGQYVVFVVNLLGTSMLWAKYGLNAIFKRRVAGQLIAVALSVAAVVALYDYIVIKFFISADEIVRNVIRLVVHPAFFIALTFIAKLGGMYMPGIPDANRPFIPIIHMVSNLFLARTLTHSIGSLLGTAITALLAGGIRVIWKLAIFKRDEFIFEIVKLIKRIQSNRSKVHPDGETSTNKDGGSMGKSKEKYELKEMEEDGHGHGESQAAKLKRQATYAGDVFIVSARRRAFYASIVYLETVAEFASLISISAFFLFIECVKPPMSGVLHTDCTVYAPLIGLQFGIEILVSFIVLFVCNYGLRLPVTMAFADISAKQVFVTVVFFYALVTTFFASRVVNFWSDNWQF